MAARSPLLFLAVTRMNLFRVFRSMKPTLWLMSGRTVGFVASFAIPIVVARTLAPAEFGTYRLVFLLYGTALMLAQCGMAESLYYFLPQQPARAGQWVSNTVAVLSAVGLIGVGLVWVGAPWIGGSFHNPLLVQELPKAAIFLALMLISTVLEIVMVCRKEFRLAAMTYGGSDAVRAVALAVPAIVARSLDALMIGAIVFAAIRCLMAVWYLRREFGPAFRVTRELWRPQFAYAMPFAASVTVEYAQVNLHRYAIALWFDPTTFAIYSVGCLQIPLVDFLATSAGNVMMVSMSERLSNGQSALPLWHETVERLAAVFMPMVAILLLVADTLIAVLFPRYTAAVPVFMVFSSLIVLAAFPVDSVLRVYAESRTLFVLSLARLILIAATIGWFVSRYHLIGAVVVTVGAAAVTRVAAISRIAVLMRAPFGRALPWRSLMTTVAASVLAVVPACTCAGT